MSHAVMQGLPPNMGKNELISMLVYKAVDNVGSSAGPC